MEGETSGEAALLQKLRDSRHRFQSHMQQLLEKYNQPFEDDPLVQMSTLTYKTPKGWKIWGGSLVKKRDQRQTQGSPVKTVSRKEGTMQATASGWEPPAPCTEDLEVDSESSVDDASLYQEDVVAGNLTPAVHWSPLKDDLRRKYLTQVDTLLQDNTYSEHGDDGDGNNTRVTLAPSLALPPRPARGSPDGVLEESPGGPLNPAASSRPCSSDLAVVPRNDSVSFQETSGNSFSSSQSFEADICNVTISDLYVGMLHSMSQLLSTRPSCVISTKTFIVQNWSSRRRPTCKSRKSRTHLRGCRHARRSPQPRPEPGRQVGVLRDRQNFWDASSHEAGLKLKRASLAVNKPQTCTLVPSWKELKGTPQKSSLLTYVDSACPMHCLDRENRLLTLKWLISPVKIVSKPRILQDEGGNRYRELENKFRKLHQEYCLSPRKQPGLPPLLSSSGVRVHKGEPASPGGPRGSETHRPGTPFSKAKPKSLSEAFGNLGKRGSEAERCLAKSDCYPSLSNTDPVRTPGHAELTSDLFQENSHGIFKKSLSLGKAVSVPRLQPLGGTRDHYDEIKENFDKLHREYCQKSPQQTKAPLCTGASPGKANVELQTQKEGFLGKSNLGSGFQRPQKLSLSPQSSTKRALGSTTIVYPQPFAKRHRLLNPQVYGSWADSQHPPRWGDRAVPRAGDEGGSSQLYLEKKRKEEHTFQDGREK